MLKPSFEIPGKFPAAKEADVCHSCLLASVGKPRGSEQVVSAIWQVTSVLMLLTVQEIPAIFTNTAASLALVFGWLALIITATLFSDDFTSLFRSFTLCSSRNCSFSALFYDFNLRLIRMLTNISGITLKGHYFCRFLLPYPC